MTLLTSQPTHQPADRTARAGRRAARRLSVPLCALALVVADPSAASAPPEIVSGPTSTLPAHLGGARSAGGPAYSVTRNATDGSVVRWDPCRPIYYRVNLTGAPRGALADVKGAVRRISQVTGLMFVYDGASTAIPQVNWGESQDERPPLTIAWARPGRGAGRSDALTGGAVAVGSYRTWGRSLDGSSWTFRIETGFVVVDAVRTKNFRPGFGTRPSIGAVLMHELGHAIGLNHAGDSREIMYPTLARGLPSAWGPGDRAGLRMVGAAAGCIPDPEPTIGLPETVEPAP
jgi:hypothetical protein